MIYLLSAWRILAAVGVALWRLAAADGGESLTAACARVYAFFRRRKPPHPAFQDGEAPPGSSAAPAALAAYVGDDAVAAARDILAAAPLPSGARSNPISVQSRFSPRGGCTELVVQVIGAAQREVLVQAYSFTSRLIAEAMVRAAVRGVRVRVLLDDGQRGYAYSQGDYCAASGVEVSYDARHAIAHNKTVVVDGRVVLTGSFNFTAAAESSNAENVLSVVCPVQGDAFRNDWLAHRRHALPPERDDRPQAMPWPQGSPPPSVPGGEAPEALSPVPAGGRGGPNAPAVVVRASASVPDAA